MDADLPHLVGLEARIAERIAPTLGDLGFEIVRLSVLGRETPTIQIMADRHDGSLISIEDCQQISYAVGAVLDVDDPIPGAWTLEVSSAGIDRPLTRPKDWERFAGHLARIELDAPVDGRKRFSGIVAGLRDDCALVRLEDGTQAALPLARVRKARLVLTDELMAASAALMGVQHEPPGDDTAAEAAEGDEKPRRPASKMPKLSPQKPGGKLGSKAGAGAGRKGGIRH